MKPGDFIYRVIKNKYDNKWYYCIYEVVRYSYHGNIKKAYIEIAPIITYYDAKHSSHTTITFLCSEAWNSVWRTSWDFISKNELSAKEIYKQKIENENQSDNKNSSVSRDRD